MLHHEIVQDLYLDLGLLFELVSHSLNCLVLN